MPSRRLALPALVAGLAALSLLLPFAPVYDPWGWLVWGREIAGLDLDTGGGPSWKPLPVVFTIVFSPAGEFAPELWLFVARAGWLACPVLAWVLAARLGSRLGPRERLVAGAIAAGSVLLLFDSFTSWTRQFTGGLSEPLLVALVLGAIERRLAGRDGAALALALAAALLRPEAWPFLVLYVAWLWRRHLLSRPALLASLAAIPILWLVPDLLGSGDALTGADRARGGSGSPPLEALEAIGRSLNLALWPLWAAAGYAAIAARRRGERTVPAVAVFAGAWIAVVAAMAAAGYAGLPRFAAPAGALACVLGALGLAELAAEVRRARRLAARLRSVGLRVLIRGSRYRRALIAAVALGVAATALVVQGAFRAAEIPGEIEQATAFQRGLDDLDALTGRITLDCAPVGLADLYFQTALAWHLDEPMTSVAVVLEGAPRRGLLFVSARSPVATIRAASTHGRVLARQGDWSVYRLECG